MDSVIKSCLNEIEHQNNVRILFACESGSRAWGFASKDSDYDVRFIYVHEKEWYLGIDDLKDVIELPVNEVLDISGWDIRKALRLMRRSNAPLLEWLQSPVIYKKDADFYSRIRQLVSAHFILKAGFHHYLSMAKNCFANELQTNNVKVKKYFYALRPILACKWIVDKMEMPPMEFGILRHLLDKNLQQTVDNLIAIKAVGDEKLFMQKDLLLNQYLETTIAYCEEKGRNLPESQNPSEELNLFFRELL